MTYPFPVSASRFLFLTSLSLHGDIHGQLDDGLVY